MRYAKLLIWLLYLMPMVSAQALSPAINPQGW